MECDCNTEDTYRTPAYSHRLAGVRRLQANLAIAFYGHLLDGAMIGEIIRLAQRQIKDEFPAQVTWAAFVRYGDPTFQLRER